jgi:1,4-dihydroxy-2-naphthoyl-CoA hydrolase
MTAPDPSAPPSAGALGDAMGIELLEVSADRVVARMPVAGNTQAYGVLHGGASCVLAATVASLAAWRWAGPGRIALGTDINATHHRAVTSGSVTAVALPAYRGRTTATYEVTITDDDGKRICTARLTCALRDAPTKS